MFPLPIVPKYDRYFGKSAARTQKAMRFNAEADRCAKYINTKIANNPSEFQSINFAMIAAELGLEASKVREYFGTFRSGWDFKVSDLDRSALFKYKSEQGL